MAQVQGVNSVYKCSVWENPKPCPPPPLLQVLFDQQLASVRGGTEKALFVDSVAVHSVAKRYAALASSMLLLMAEYDSDETGECKGGGAVHSMAKRYTALASSMLLLMAEYDSDETGECTGVRGRI